MRKKPAKGEVVAQRAQQPQPSPQQNPQANVPLVLPMVVRLVSPYTLLLLVLLDFFYLLIEALSVELLPLQLLLYVFAGINGAVLVFISEYLTNKNSTFGEKSIIALIGGIVTALPFPVLGIGAGIGGLIAQWLSSRKGVGK